MQHWIKFPIQPLDIELIKQQYLLNNSFFNNSICYKQIFYIDLKFLLLLYYYCYNRFWIYCGFPDVIGAVDDTHVAIWPPEKEREHLYINRKLYYSLNVLIASIIEDKILS